MKRQFTLCVYANLLLVAGLSGYLFFDPVFILVQDLRDPALATGAIPQFAFRWHRQLSPSIETWAYQRVASGKASQLSINNLSGTEWPVFNSVFYLWATESLQAAWERDPSLSQEMPKEYAKGAIEAASALISDPNHAAWVKRHWGDDYLSRENLFYRMLLISGLTSYQRLLGNSQYEQLLSSQVESLSSEIDQSPYGLLDDYPGQCYPIDILPAISAIRRADFVLGTDHSAFADRAVRAFQDSRLDADTGLPAYICDAQTGQGIGPARGVGIAYMLIWAPELWPETARHWQAGYEKHFWQQNWLVAGVREFANDSDYPAWSMGDVDAGPVLAGYGTAASAFGIGAARVNGRFDQAYALSAEALLVAWPLPNGTLLIPRMLSNLSDAPYIGETILLFDLTRQPVVEYPSSGKFVIPGVVYLGIAIYLSLGLALIAAGIDAVRRWQKYLKNTNLTVTKAVFALRATLCLLGLAVAIIVNPFWGLVLALLAQLFPRQMNENSL